MQDELKNVISQAMNSNSEFEQESTTQFEELSEEDLEVVAGGICLGWSLIKQCKYWSIIRNGNDKV
ncbi:hypothetical protein SAMD00079811_02760 [Scytonema sp. HK-05]|uniref:hypothetical protein n=1 Tax=Scytonema sp. HK-05 TaxID=1137095 RepID=UPI000936482C|nr:hypothetical protein [Scytonema sp. HK-05]OKH60010.1 hypothetical protein NIES2130_06020 [Scytonema sp. HK-05]BAY42698.1 hypothetical protein SAMD00079811_02760 [Scytonema sp. HK-05]